MMPDHLYSSYKRYKADTDYVANWLTTTAQQCGYVSPTRQEGSIASESKFPRLNSDHPHMRKDHTYQIDIKEFVPLAEYIAKSRNLRVESSETFASVLQYCIRERSRHLAYHHRSGTVTGSSGDNLRHNNFIRILQQVQDILQPLLPKSSTSDQNGTSQGMTGADMGNIFESFNIDEPSETTEYDKRSHETFKPEAPRYTTNLGSSEEEVRIATAMLFSDVHRLRDVVKGVWLLFHENKLDLMAAYITTNTAIDFTRSIQLELENTFPGQVDLSEERCYACAYIEDQSAGPIPLPCLETARCVFRVFKKEYLDGTSDFVPMVAPANLALYDKADVKGLSSTQPSCFSDLKLAMGVIPEFCVLIKKSSSLQAEHELIKGLRQVVNEKKEVFWATFAIQAFLDMRNVLREHVGRGFEHLRRESKTITRSVKVVLKLHQIPNPTLGPNEETLQQVVELIERWTESDFVGDCRNSLLADLSASAHMERFHLLRRDPLLCGLLLYNFRMVSYEGAIILTNSFLCVQATAHLYNYLRQTKLLQQDWTDMDYVFAAHDRTEIFLGDLPSTATDCCKQIFLAFGMSLCTFAQNKRPTDRFGGSPTNAKRLQKRVPLAEVFKSRFCDNDGRSGFELQHLEGVLQDLCKVTARGPQIRMGMCMSLMNMARTLHQEAKELSFDYLLLHKICWSMLSRLVDELADTNEEIRFYRSNPKYLPESVACLLCDGVYAERSGPTKDVCTTADTVKRMLLVVGNMASANLTEVLNKPSLVDNPPGI